MWQSILCFFSFHSEIEDRMSAGVYEYDITRKVCEHCKKQLTEFRPT